MIEVAPGVVWMRMPLPFVLKHINVWGLEDNDGWAVVDTGMRTDETLAAWREIFSKTTEQRPLTRIFATRISGARPKEVFGWPDDQAARL